MLMWKIVKSPFLFVMEKPTKLRTTHFLFVLLLHNVYVICFSLVIIILLLLFWFIFLCFWNFSFLLYIYVCVCVFSYPPFLFFCSSSPFYSFAISSSLSCAPFFSLFRSLVFFRSVKISSFSLSLSFHHRGLFSSLLVTLLIVVFLFFLFFFLFPICLPSSSWACFLFSKTMVFKNTPQKQKRTHAKFLLTP